MTRRLRAFKRWMRCQGIQCSDALELTDGGADAGISVKALGDLTEGDVVATIPKHACITIKTSAARVMIEDTELGGHLGLAVALMYERSLGEKSLWAGYLQLLPERECLPMVWTLDEVDRLLCGTELQKIIKVDKTLMYEDWKEFILPLISSASLKLDHFGVEQYFAAKSLIASRSFEIDNYHGVGMVPLADLFNHKTGAEDVHITSVSSVDSSDSDIDDNDDACQDNNSYFSVDDDNSSGDLHPRKSDASTALVKSNSLNDDNVEFSSSLGDGPAALQMIVVKDVKAGTEVYNTYGNVGNAALLHRYGFTELDNPFNIVNIDLSLVMQWSSSLFSGRYSRARISLWRRLGCSGCVSQNSEYFEISSVGEPQIELLLLLYIMFLPEEAYHKLNQTVSTVENINKSMNILLGKCISEGTKMAKDLMLTGGVCDALMLLADIREGFYGSNALEDDIEALSCCIKERKLYNSLALRVSERRILANLKTYASQSRRTTSRALSRKRLKRKCKAAF